MTQTNNDNFHKGLSERQKNGLLKYTLEVLSYGIAIGLILGWMIWRIKW